MKKVIFFISFLLLAGCATAINEKNAHSYANSAAAAQQRGDWDIARRHWAKATVNAQLAKIPEKNLAIAYYEYGRSAGVTCFFDISETYLKKSLDIDNRVQGPVHMSLLELARLHYDQTKYNSAISYYQKLLPIYERIKAENIDPVGVALVYEEYAFSLKQIGQGSLSNNFLKRAKNLRSSSTKVSDTERTPYGKHCVEEKTS